MAQVAARVRIGTSGYAYADWSASNEQDDESRGQGQLFLVDDPIGAARPRFAFYPHGVKDKLAWYAKHFDTVEINSSYYGVPTVRDTARWVERTPDGFSFWVKVHRDTTHGMQREAAPLLAQAVAPLRESGKLAGLLAQFPSAFRCEPRSVAYLEALVEDFFQDPIAIEFRHASWACPEMVETLKRLGLIGVGVDEPALPELFPSKPWRIETKFVRRAKGRGATAAYIRFHSRDGAAWYGGEASRYDYFFLDEELKPWALWVKKVAEKVKAEAAVEVESDASNATPEIYIYFNNCKRGQAAENARRFSEILKELGEVGG